MDKPSTAKLLQEGLAMHRAGMRREAMDCYIQVLRENPENADALYYVAVMTIQEGQTEDGVKLVRRALSFDPKQARLHNLLGQGLHRLGRQQEALDAFGRAVELNPDYADAHGNRAHLLAELGRPGEALLGFDHALKLRPNSADDWCNRGATLHDLGRLAEALESYDQAIARDPQLVGAHVNRAEILRDLGQLDFALGKSDTQAFDDAEKAYSTAIRLEPQLADARAGRAILRLLRGQWESGWPDYEFRTHIGPPAFATLPDPQWRGEELRAGERLVLVTERDVGDIITFSRFAPLLASRGYDVTVLAHKLVCPLLSTLRGVKVATSESELREDPRPIKWLLLNSAAGVLDVRPETVPGDVPYLTVEPERVAKWAARLGTEGFKIGISWARTADGSYDLKHDIPPIKFVDMASLPGVRLISLQAGPRMTDIARLPFRDRIETIDIESAANPSLDTAAVMSLLDLIIACDSPLAHLAGALGRPVFAALPVMSDWRWLLGRTDTPWYPTMRLFRQGAPHHWNDVFGQMNSEVTRRVA